MTPPALPESTAPENVLPESVNLYLNAVTCLLLPRTARQVRAEFLGHLAQDMRDAQLEGLAEQEAWNHALTLAGPAWKAALGLGRVHTLGLLLRGLLLGAALGGASYALQSGVLNGPHAQVSRP